MCVRSLYVWFMSGTMKMIAFKRQHKLCIVFVQHILWCDEDHNKCCVSLQCTHLSLARLLDDFVRFSSYGLLFDWVWLCPVSACFWPISLFSPMIFRFNEIFIQFLMYIIFEDQKDVIHWLWLPLNLLSIFFALRWLVAVVAVFFTVSQSIGDFSVLRICFA